MKILAYVAGVLAALIALVGARFIIPNYIEARCTPYPPHQLHLPGITMEFVTSGDDIKCLLNGKDSAGNPLNCPNVSGKAAKIDEGQKYDPAFILLYWLLFMFLSWLLARQPRRWAIPLAVLTVVCATGSALFDILENHRIAIAFANSDNHTDAVAAQINFAAHWKWGLSFVAIGLLSFLFIWLKDWGKVIGCLCWLLFALGIGGLLWHKPLVEIAFVALAPLLGLMAWLLLRHPDSFLLKH